MSDQWQQRSLASLGSYENGFAFNELHWSEHGLPIIRIAQITGSQGIVDRFPGMLPDSYRIDDGDLIFSWSGTLAVVRWSGGPAWLNQHLFKVVPADGIDRSFLFHVLQASVAEMGKRTHGSTMKHIKRGELREFLIEIPGNEREQRKIAQILDTLDGAIRETEALIDKLKAVKQGLLHDLLTRGIDANGELRPPQSEAPHLYKQSPLGWIPKEWEAWPLAKSIQLVSGQHIPSDLCNIVGKGVPYFTGPSDFLGASTVVTQYTNYPQIMCDAGDILITVKGSGCGKVAVASVRACISRQLMAIKVPHSTLQYWLAVFQNQQELLNRLATGGNIPGISRTQILNLTLPTPRSANEMSEIGDRICALDSQLVAEQQFLEKLRLQRAGLMDDLLTGRVRVTPLLTTTRGTS